MTLIEKECPNCSKKFKESLFNIKKQQKFCSRSCGASFNNQIRKIDTQWKSKISNTLKEKYRKDGPWGNLGRSDKKYHSNCMICNAEILLKRKTCSDKCLAEFRKQNPPPINSGGYRKGSGRGKHGWYNGIYFDSTYELAFYIYCKNNNLQIERCKQTFKYINSRGKQRTYHPDFRVNGKITEIKGYYCPDVDLKIKSVNEPIDILYKKDLKYVFTYISNKYKTTNFASLYDGYKPKYDYVCTNCRCSFSRDKKLKTINVFCSVKCSGHYNGILRFASSPTGI